MELTLDNRQGSKQWALQSCQGQRDSGQQLFPPWERRRAPWPCPAGWSLRCRQSPSRQSCSDRFSASWSRSGRMWSRRAGAWARSWRVLPASGGWWRTWCRRPWTVWWAAWPLSGRCWGGTWPGSPPWSSDCRCPAAPSPCLTRQSCSHTCTCLCPINILRNFFFKPYLLPPQNIEHCTSWGVLCLRLSPTKKYILQF